MRIKGDLGPERIPISQLKYRYNCEKISAQVSLYLNETAKIAFEEGKKGKLPDIYVAIQLAVPKNDLGIFGDLPSKVYRIPPSTVQPFSIPRREWEGYRIDSFAFCANPYYKEDLLTTLDLLLEHEKINYSPFIGEEDGIIRFSRNKTGETSINLFPLHRKTFKKEKFTPPFKEVYDFLPYYVDVVYAMNKMYVKELYDNVNVAVSRLSEELLSEKLVGTRRTKNGKDIRVNSPEEIMDLVSWGAFEFFLENNKCWLKETNCRACDKPCWPNIVIDIDPGKRVSDEKLLNLLQIIHKNLDEEGINYITKFTGKRGFHITLYFDTFELPENYIPLKVLKHYKEMSVKQTKQLIKILSNDPFEVARDFLRCKTEEWEMYGLDFILHDFSTQPENADLDFVKIDALSVKRRGYHRAPYSLTQKFTACLPLCTNGMKLTREDFENVKKISSNPSEILKHEKELLDIKIKYNDPSYIKDYLEEKERKIFAKQFNEVRRKIGI
jgi:hypothetical protein